MAKLWIVCREGLRLVGAPVADVRLDQAVPRLDLAPWRLFSKQAPDPLPEAALAARRDRKRALIEVQEADREALCGLVPGFFESPYSLAEIYRRLGLSSRVP